MSEQIKKTTGPATSNQLFDKGNYMWMLIGLAVLALGFFLMAGGKSNDPRVFNANEVYSTTRITIAPMLIIAGFIIEIFAIMKKSKSN
jgi:cytochrome bd-type quinol oxidase subunit 2